jgi:hypothetical protein
MKKLQDSISPYLGSSYKSHHFLKSVKLRASLITNTACECGLGAPDAPVSSHTINCLISSIGPNLSAKTSLTCPSVKVMKKLTPFLSCVGDARDD